MKATLIITFAVVASLGNAAHGQQVLSSFQSAWLDQQFAGWNHHDKTQHRLPGHSGNDREGFFGPGGDFSAFDGSSHQGDDRDIRTEAWKEFMADFGYWNGRYDFEKYDGGNFGHRGDDGADCGGTNSGGSSGGGGSQIPEPSTYAVLLGVAAFGFVVHRRKREALTS